jgi:pyrophosphatase PpaX
MKFLAVLSDVDGTIIPLDSVVKCLKDTCRHFKVRVLTKREILEKTIGYKLTESIPRLLPETKKIIKDFVQFYEKLYVKDFKKYARPFPYVKSTFRKLKRKNVRIGIVTTKKHSEAKAILEGYGIPYDVIIGNDDVKKRKPDPEPVFKACKILGVRPESCVFVGDHPFDMVAAKKAGCTAVGVLTGWGNRIKLKKSGADFIIKNLKSLDKLIE